MFSSIISYKLLTSDVEFDFGAFKLNDILALITSLFAIGMSVAFYFKTTDTSNRFYDNTYRFTKDISSTLSGIESGFREMLQNIQARNTSIESKIDGLRIIKDQIKGKVEEEAISLNETKHEKEEIIKEFASKTQAKQEDIEKLLTQLKEKDDRIFQQQESIVTLNNRIEELDKKRLRAVARVRIEKLNDLADALYPNNIRVGYVTEGKFVNEPKVGEPFCVGYFFKTSIVKEIIDENTFKTRNSIYRWTILEQ